MSDLSLLGLSGSLRQAATSRSLLRAAAHQFGPCTYAEGNLRLPLYDGDAEEAEGIPAEVQALADQIEAADAVILCSPEYNSAPSGVIKNALDWVSRVEGRPFRDKPVAVMTAAAGASGGMRAQVMLRAYLGSFRPRLLTGPEVHVGRSYEGFDAEGNLTDARQAEALRDLMQALRASVRAS